jgi:hypothetical protein
MTHHRISLLIKFKDRAFSNQRTKIIIIFGLIFGFLGTGLILYTRAASQSSQLEVESGNLSGNATVVSDSLASGDHAVSFNTENTNTGPATFKLHSPAWRGLGEFTATRTLNSVTSTFKELFGHDDDLDPSKIHSTAKAYKYTLGLYVLPQRVPCSIFPPTHEDEPKCAANNSDPNWLDPSAFAKDANGKAVYPVRFRNNFLIVPDSDAWKADLLKTSETALKYKNTGVQWDGLFADSMGSPLGDLNSEPLSYPAYDNARWLVASKTALQVQRTYLNNIGKSLMLNGLATGNEYFASTGPTSIFADSLLVNGVMSERVFREPISSTTTFKSTASWLKDVEMIEDVERKGLNGYWWSKCWSDEKTVRACRDDADQAAVARWRRYAVGSYLLGAGSKSYFNWDEDYDYIDTAAGDVGEAAAEYYTEYDRAITLGTASASKTLVAGFSNIYKRNFSNGIVYVNPTSIGVTINLPDGSYKKFDTSLPAVSGAVSLSANTAEIFIKQ